ncbi:hypothetical protein E2C01_016063 [Portunus trituberculatus]|uniref:Uncharacterized protein n=1 Tax=Portunus trituberculatus TaxID=210409 RepID=A0A5B7DPL7_PORTR|nr:hypothetical protein [Portunus trituberculatus]
MELLAVEVVGARCCEVWMLLTCSRLRTSSRHWLMSSHSGRLAVASSRAATTACGQRDPTTFLKFSPEPRLAPSRAPEASQGSCCLSRKQHSHTYPGSEGRME